MAVTVSVLKSIEYEATCAEMAPYAHCSESRGQLVTFHDRPPSHFRRLTPAERQAFFDRAPHLSPSPKGAQDRRLAVSSTSWTADEDFGLLLNALSRVAKAYNQSAQPMASLLVVITGKGPMKAAFEDELNRRSNQERWQGVEVRFAWLESSDYPLLLGECAADPTPCFYFFFWLGIALSEREHHTTLWRRLGGLRHFVAHQLVRIRPADESGGHVRLWSARRVARFPSVSGGFSISCLAATYFCMRD